MKTRNKRRVSKKELIEVIREEKPELLLTVGAGDIDTLVQPLKQVLQNV
jgi:UDP-N-acetylmuramate--alanine ligase